MSLTPLTLRDGLFYRQQQQVLLNGPVYFPRKPGTCSGDFFPDALWPEALGHMERDFARMRELGCTMAVPFVKATLLWKDGKPVESMFARMQTMIDLATQHELYLIPFISLGARSWPEVLGRPLQEGVPGGNRPAFNPEVYEALYRNHREWLLRFGQQAAVPLIGGPVGNRLWTAYAGFRPGEPEAAELLPVKPRWQQWLREQYADDFDAFLSEHPRLPEAPARWEEVALPVEVSGQFTEADSRTFTFLKFQAHSAAETSRRFHRQIKEELPWARSMGIHEGCEYNTGPQETYIPGLIDYDAVWVEMYGFNMTSGSHVAPDWQREGFFEPTTGKQAIDSLSVISEAWERARYLKAAAPKTAFFPCHGSVMTAFLRWAMGEREQRILYERLQRTYLEAGAAGIGFWCWSDDETSARPEPEFIEREGEQMGVIDYHEAYRPIARRMYAYQHAAPPVTRVSGEVLLLRPTPHFMGMDMVDGNMTAACLTSALARLGVNPEVKASWYQGRGPMPVEELLPYKLVVVAADEYRKDFPEMPQRLLEYVRQGGRVLLAMSEAGEMLTPTFQQRYNPALAELLGYPHIEATYHQHYNPWTVSLRWRILPGVLPYWDARQGRYMPGRREKRMTFKWITLPDTAQLLAEAIAPAPEKGDDPTQLQKYFIQQQKMGPWSPLFYRQPIGAGAVYVCTYSLNVFRSRLDEIDVQRDDWDWMLQLAIDEAQVTTDPMSSLSMLAQEFLNFRPTMP